MPYRLAACGAILAMAGAAQAHHSIAGMYDSSRDSMVDGVVAEFQFIYPHPILVVDIRRGGVTERWQLEMDNRRELADIGFTGTTLKAGDRVVASGNPARRDARRMYVRRLDRPADGFAYEQVGTRPRIRTLPR
jgi:hypothetical protein